MGMTTELSSERVNRPWVALEDDVSADMAHDALGREMAKAQAQTGRADAQGGSMTSEVQDAMAGARDELRSEGEERMRRLEDEARRRAPADTRDGAWPSARRGPMAFVGILALIAIVAGVIIWSRITAAPKSREEEFFDRSREAFERSREALDALLARLPDAA